MANLNIFIADFPGMIKIVRFLKGENYSLREFYTGEIGRYKVDVLSLEKHFPILIPSSEEIIIIDKIGKMECFSQKFKDFLWDLLSKPHPLLGRISSKGNKFIEKIKHLPQVRLKEGMSKNNE